MHDLNKTDVFSPPAYISRQGFSEMFNILWDALYALCDVARRCLLPIVATALMAKILYLPQSIEFFAGMLQICKSEPEHCVLGYAVQASATQFLVFDSLLMLFSVCVWQMGRVLVSHRKPPRALRKRYTRAVEIWLPRLLGALPLYLAATVILAPLAKLDNDYDRTAFIQLVSGLGYVTFWIVLPLVLREHASNSFSRRKMWIGLITGIFSVSFCTVQPEMIHTTVWLFVPLTCILMCYGAFAYQLEGLTSHRALAALAVIGLTCVAFYDIFITTMSATKGAKWTWTVTVTMMLPAFFMAWVMFRRRSGLQRLGRLCCIGLDRSLGFRKPASRLAPHLPWRTVMLWFLTLLVLLALGILAGANPEDTSAFLDAPAAVMLWLIIVLLLAFGFFFVVSLVFRFMLSLVLIAVILIPQVPKMETDATQPLPKNLCNERAGICEPGEVIAKQFDAWQTLRGGADDDKPVIIVSAAGGGSRAAVHTATMLSAVDDATCGEFGNRLFAISAVSGGALGAAAYVASREDLPRTAGVTEACWRIQAPMTRPDSISLGLMQMTVQDHLSPTLIRWLFHDLPLSFLPGWARPAKQEYEIETRAGTLRKSWANAYQHFLDVETHTARHQEVNALLRGRSEAPGRTDGRSPFVLLNSTAAQDGRRVVLSHPLFCPLDGYCAAVPQPLLSDAIDSARFPLISPANNRDVYGWNPWQRSRTVAYRSLVDGGYADNSGLVTLNEVVDGLLDHGVKAERIYVIVITSNPEEEMRDNPALNYADGGLLAQLQTPFDTVISARDSRTDGVIQSLTKKLAVDRIIYWPMTKRTLNHLDPKEVTRLELGYPPENKAIDILHHRNLRDYQFEHTAPLGWALSQEAAQWAKDFSGKGYGAYAYPDRDHPYDYEKALIRILNDHQSRP